MSSDDTESHERRAEAMALFLELYDSLFQAITGMATLGVINDEEDKKLASITDELTALHKSIGERITGGFVKIEEVEKVEVLKILNEHRDGRYTRIGQPAAGKKTIH